MNRHNEHISHFSFTTRLGRWDLYPAWDFFWDLRWEKYAYALKKYQNLSSEVNMTHGGKRQGAGRPIGKQGKKAIALSEFLNADENNPVLNLVSIGHQALKEKDLRLAADCFKALIPYYAPKVKIPEEAEAERYRPITVVTNIPIPGQTWRKNAVGKEQVDGKSYEDAGDDC